jgi:hypothetical protein
MLTEGFGRHNEQQIRSDSIRFQTQLKGLDAVSDAVS